MIQEHISVVLTKCLPALGLEPGTIGVVVHVNTNGLSYEVEFMTPRGETIGVETLLLSEVRPTAEDDSNDGKV
jgi:hypothetical protein